MLGCVQSEDEGGSEVIGFASLQDQIHRKALKRGFDFTLMVVGESGLGKSTLVSSLFFNPELYRDRALPAAYGSVVSQKVSKDFKSFLLN